MACRPECAEPGLRALQIALWSTITARTAPHETLVGVVAHDGGLSPEQRVAVYAGMYRTRLLDCLAQDFAKLRVALGSEAFEQWMERYLRVHPSTSPTLRNIGRHLPDFLRTQAEEPARQWLADLAQLEWSRVDVLDRIDEPLMSSHELARHAATGFSELRLRAVSAHVVLRLASPVIPLWRALAEGHSQPPATELASSPSHAVLVWRRPDQCVYHRAADDLEATCLTLLGAQPTAFADLCALASETLAPRSAAMRMAALLTSWLEEGLLAAATS